MRNYGQQTKNQHTMLGYNSRLDTIQAAVLLVKLNYLEKWNEQRRAVAQMYRELLADAQVELPLEKAGVQHVYHLFVIQHDRRDELIAYLKTQGVSCGIHYPTPLHEVAPFKSARTVPERAPVSSRLAKKILSLPMYPELTREQAHQVVHQIKSFAPAAAPSFATDLVIQ
jgi:dTDP-4-amino-4,6-dideoxygalactose transaminase